MTIYTKTRLLLSRTSSRSSHGLVHSKKMTALPRTNGFYGSSSTTGWWNVGSPRMLSSYPPHEVVGLPNLSPTMESGSIARWNLAEGDEFGPGDVFCEVETDKATVDFEAQDEGVVARILAPAGPADLMCGDPIMITVEDAADVAAFKDYSVAAGAPPPAAEPAAAPPVATPPPAAPATVAAPVPVAVPAAVPTTGGKVVASPKARVLAAARGIDLSALVGTGPGGRILAADVEEYVPPPPTVEAAAEPTAIESIGLPVPGSGYVDYPVSTSAREVAARLAASKSRVPHYYLTVDLELDSLLAMRERLNDAILSKKDDSDYAGLTLNDFLVKAAACAMAAVPSANASWMDSHVRVYDRVDVNVAVGLGDGLALPMLKDVGGRGLGSISKEMATYVTAAAAEDPEEATIPSEAYGTGTFTVLNLGMYGVKSCAPIITEPQACALALGAAEARIVPNDSDNDGDEIYREATMLTATLSCDHRVVDGAVGAQWLSAFKNHVENPETLLL